MFDFKIIPILFLVLSLNAIKEYHFIDNNETILIDDESENIGATWNNGIIWERSLVQKFYDLLPKDRQFCVFDIGAQTGCFSLMAKYFPKSTWYAFEPIIEAAIVLKKNLELNNINNVHVNNVALANYLGTITLSMPDKSSWGLATVGDNPLRFSTQSQRVINCIDLDTFVLTNNIEKVDFIKIDTEGAEFLILNGGKKIIQRDRPIMLMEYNETNMKQCGINKIDIDNFLTEMGYKWYLISSEDIICFPIY